MVVAFALDKSAPICTPWKYWPDTSPIAKPLSLNGPLPGSQKVALYVLFVEGSPASSKISVIFVELIVTFALLYNPIGALPVIGIVTGSPAF